MLAGPNRESVKKWIESLATPTRVIFVLRAVAGLTADETATLREDRERPSLSNSEALANAPVSGSGYFKVPRVIER